MKTSSSKKISEYEGTLERLIESYGSKGLFTHCYLECGVIGGQRIFSTSKVFQVLPWLRGQVPASIVSQANHQSIFDFASLTKALVTAPIAFATVGESGSGLHGLNARLGDFLDQSRLPKRLMRIRIRELLAHSSGLPAWINFWIGHIDSACKLSDNFNQRHLTIEETLKRVGWSELTKGVDRYSCVGFVLLTYLIEQVTGKSLESLFRQYLAERVDLSGVDFIGGPIGLQMQKQTCISTGYCKLRERYLQGEVHDENCFGLGGFSGNAGLFGTGQGLGKMLRAAESLPLLQHYFDANQRVFSESKSSGLLGLRKADDPSSMGFGHGHGMGHLGFTGTGFWVDWRRRWYGIVLTNRVFGGRISKDIAVFRRHAFSELYNLLSLQSQLQL